MNYGEVDRDFIRKDSDKHRARWPIRHYKLASSVDSPKRDCGHNRRAYRVAFAVENDVKVISGEAAVSGDFRTRIIAIKETGSLETRQK